MSSEREEWSRRIKAVEREFLATRFAVERTISQVRLDSSILTANLKLREIVGAAEMLEATYTLRLFAEFESAVRLCFQRIRKKRPPNKTEDLLNSVGSHWAINANQLKNAHRVREYRNGLAHQQHREIEPIGVAESRGHLCYFLSFLPRDW